MTLLVGDLNYVCHDRDRMNKADGGWSGSADRNDESFFQKEVAEIFDLHEWEQEHFTCETAQARSRIDRVYTNQHITAQLDRNISCAALEWVKGLSAHRPITFGRISAQRSELKASPLPTAPMDDKDWGKRIQLGCGKYENPHLAVRRLVLLKHSIRQVTQDMSRENQINIAQTEDDKLGWIMSFIRAAEENRVARMEKCVKAYPHLGVITRARPDVRTSLEMNAVRDHAVGLARSSITEELVALQQESANCDELTKNRRKNTF